LPRAGQIEGQDQTMPKATLLLTAAALGLVACGSLPDLRPRRAAPAPAAAAVALPAPAVIAPDPAASPAAAAEAACLAAGRERGFEVRGVAGSADVAGTDGQPVSRDVMLQVARGAQVFELRCSYHYGSAMARVMAL